MSLDIQAREHESVTVLDLSGRVTAGQEAGALREKVTELEARGSKNIIFNMAGVDYIDSTGLGTLVICATNLRKQGGSIKLLNVNKRNLELLVLTKLATVFDLFTDEQDAVNSFYPDREIKRFDILQFVQQMKQEDE